MMEHPRSSLTARNKTGTIDTEGYDKVFLLTASRPNELSHVDDLSVLNKLISYTWGKNQKIKR